MRNIGPLEHGPIGTVAYNGAKTLLRERVEVKRIEVDQTNIVAKGLQLRSDLGTDRPNTNDHGFPYLIVA